MNLIDKFQTRLSEIHLLNFFFSGGTISKGKKIIKKGGNVRFVVYIINF